jgi:hypothetical protein
MRNLYEALPEALRGRWVETAQDLAAQAHRLVDAGDVILVKGSSPLHLERAIRSLLQDPGQADRLVVRPEDVRRDSIPSGTGREREVPGMSSGTSGGSNRGR